MDWHPKKIPDWSLEKRCIPCRMGKSKVEIFKTIRYTPVTCRACKFINIFKCEECGDEIGFCTMCNDPPSLKIDMKRKCVIYKNGNN